MPWIWGVVEFPQAMVSWFATMGTNMELLAILIVHIPGKEWA